MATGRRAVYSWDMDRLAAQNTAASPHGRLYPPIEPFDRRRLDRGDGHVIYVEQCGNPAGIPVIVLHGGPGGGCSPVMRRFFDPARWRIVLFDQRACGLSTPQAEVAANTTAHLLGDIDAIVAALGVGPAVLFGGSWGATLALAYAQARPAAVRALVLRGVFLGRQSELDWFYQGGAGRFWPELWARFAAPIPAAERGDMIAAYHRRLFSGDREVETRAALGWTAWENALAAMDNPCPGVPPPAYARAFARLECHYFANRCFLDEGQLLRDRHRIAHLPAVIVQGRYDMVCPPQSAWELACGWDAAELRLVPASGHALTEPRIAAELVRATDELAAL